MVLKRRGRSSRSVGHLAGRLWRLIGLVLVALLKLANAYLILSVLFLYGLVYRAISIAGLPVEKNCVLLPCFWRKWLSYVRKHLRRHWNYGQVQTVTGTGWKRRLANWQMLKLMWK